MKIIDIADFEKYSPLFRGKNKAEFFMKFFAIDKVNLVYEHSDSFTGPEFTRRLLKDLGVNYEIGNAENLRHLPGKAFITIANHPYGGLDGIILIDMMGKIRPDYRLMVNSMLSMVKTLSQNFISVTPAGNRKEVISVTSLTGIRETMTALREGHAIGFFPSGAVSDFTIKDMRIRDRKWQDSILRLIRHMKVPVLPVKFLDRNSDFFYFLGLINWRVRSLRLPSELFNKKGRRTRLGIGNLISVEEQQHFKDISSFGSFLRDAVYEMPYPASFLPCNMLEQFDSENVELNLDARIV